jgi:hypothetical protein
MVSKLTLSWDKIFLVLPSKFLKLVHLVLVLGQVMKSQVDLVFHSEAHIR